ncbi:hypothetical protein P4T04_10130 [Bacillus badius]|uniref:hypothetical protein n=1 Tax=Bacillus badius TaxID=1455 RepID=UPI002E1FC608|nr:hypothetical protein [Bacillus badius]
MTVKKANGRNTFCLEEEVMRAYYGETWLSSETNGWELTRLPQNNVKSKATFLAFHQSRKQLFGKHVLPVK